MFEYTGWSENQSARLGKKMFTKTCKRRTRVNDEERKMSSATYKIQTLRFLLRTNFLHFDFQSTKRLPNTLVTFFSRHRIRFDVHLLALIKDKEMQIISQTSPKYVYAKGFVGKSWKIKKIRLVWHCIVLRYWRPANHRTSWCFFAIVNKIHEKRENKWTTHCHLSFQLYFDRHLFISVWSSF